MAKYPEIYPEVLKISKKTQGKSIIKFNQILEFCKEPKSISEIMKKLGYKSNKILKRNYIKPLIELNKLQMIIPDKPTSKSQKYITIK